MFFFTWFFVPETKGMSLEKMDEVFGVTELAEKKIESRNASVSEATPATTIDKQPVQKVEHVV